MVNIAFNRRHNTERTYRYATMAGTSFLVTYGWAVSEAILSAMSAFVVADVLILAALYAADVGRYALVHTSLYPPGKHGFGYKRGQATAQYAARNFVMYGLDVTAFRLLSTVFLGSSLGVTAGVISGYIALKILADVVYDIYTHHDANNNIRHLSYDII